jgi:hypothetical protein
MTLAVSGISTAAAAGAGYKPCIGIIIDDIGYRYHDDQAAIGLPGPLAYAVMPLSPHGGEMARLASELGKIVMLHLPMQASDSYENQFLGPGALTLNMTKRQILQTLNADLRSLPDISGVNNHMGSLLTQYPVRMEWVMKDLKAHKKFYVDSMTSHRSVAGTVAQELHVPTMRRDVFLDDKQNVNYIRGQFKKLIAIARRKGTALAIGHPRPDTIKVLSRQLRLLKLYGVRLVSVQTLLRDRGQQPGSAVAGDNSASDTSEGPAPAALGPVFITAHALASH